MGISLSTTTRRRAPAHPYPPSLHPHPLDYYLPHPMHPPAYPAHNPPAYYHYYSSSSYTACSPANPLVGQPYFGPIELQPPQPQPRVVAPPCGEQKPAKVVNSDVNVHKDSLRLETDEMNPDHYLVSFVFDALVDGSITIYYFAKEEANCRVAPLFPETYVPIKVPFRKGLHQEFRQPLGTGIDLRYFALESLSSPLSRDDVFPIVISADTCSTPYIIDDRSYLLAHPLPQMQITQVAVTKDNEGEYNAKVIRQLLFTDNICYELREIYGLGKSSPGFSDNGSGKECVICMTEPKDVAVLPCRHMCMCSNCAKALRLQSNKCPICREIIESLLEIKIDNIL
ncbi:putative E3 ubiquitin ligase [Handroanthus impetiginosus]|uniref:RING-type E3 ubiquitin transferase n=1 Tax=Handroanthus impetiginosus TaxID=429701 RepID=A0A2G9G5M8_9LAMI|nr:putative E3 ubiquitin ligase [Handroanthus impetiginosus]